MSFLIVTVNIEIRYEWLHLFCNKEEYFLCTLQNLIWVLFAYFFMSTVNLLILLLLLIVFTNYIVGKYTILDAANVLCW